jgi:hypothetical protein
VEIHAEKGVSCGCGTVLFKTQEEAQNAIGMLIEAIFFLMQ